MKTFKLVATGLLAGVLFWLCVQTGQLKTVKAENTWLRSELEATITTAERTLNALETAHAEDLARLKATHDRLTAIDTAPESDDGPVAPVLARTLESLRDGL